MIKGRRWEGSESLMGQTTLVIVSEATRFATCVGSFVVEGKGIEGIPTREEVTSRMEEHYLPWEEQPP